MPFAPPSPDTLVEDKPAFTPPSPNSLIKDPHRDYQSQEEPWTTPPPPESLVKEPVVSKAERPTYTDKPLFEASLADQIKPIAPLTARALEKASIRVNAPDSKSPVSALQEIMGVTQESNEQASGEVARAAAAGSPWDVARKGNEISERYRSMMLNAASPRAVVALEEAKKHELDALGVHTLDILPTAKLPTLTDQESRALISNERGAAALKVAQNVASGFGATLLGPEGAGMGPGAPAALAKQVGRAFIPGMAASVLSKTAEAARAYGAGDVKAGDAAAAEALSTGLMLSIPVLEAKLGRKATKTEIADNAIEQQKILSTAESAPTIAPETTAATAATTQEPNAPNPQQVEASVQEQRPSGVSSGEAAETSGGDRILSPAPSGETPTRTPQGDEVGPPVVPAEATQVAPVADKRVRLKDLRDKIEALAKKGGLTSSEAVEFKALNSEANTIRYEIAKPIELKDIPPASERQSTLSPEVVLAARNDLVRNKDVYDSIIDSAIGVSYDANTAVDDVMEGKNPKISPQQFYDSFEATREAMRKQYGDSVTLFRAEGKQRKKATQNWATTREYAEQFGDRVISRNVPIDDIIGVNVGLRGKYHEVIVGKKPLRPLPVPLTPDMPTARRIVEMTPEEFMAQAKAFNGLNLKLGENATATDLAELRMLRDKAEARRVEALNKAKASGLDADKNEALMLSSMPQFYNEAIKVAEVRLEPATGRLITSQNAHTSEIQTELRTIDNRTRELVREHKAAWEAAIDAGKEAPPQPEELSKLDARRTKLRTELTDLLAQERDEKLAAKSAEDVAAIKPAKTGDERVLPAPIAQPAEPAAGKETKAVVPTVEGIQAQRKKVQNLRKKLDRQTNGKNSAFLPPPIRGETRTYLDEQQLKLESMESAFAQEQKDAKEKADALATRFDKEQDEIVGRIQRSEPVTQVELDKYFQPDSSWKALAKERGLVKSEPAAPPVPETKPATGEPPPVSVKWEKVPSVMTGGKKYFSITKDSDGRNWSAVWSKSEKKWLSQNPNHETIGRFDSERKAQQFVESKINQPVEPTLEPPAEKPGETEQGRTASTKDPFERARAGDETAYDDLDAQFREIYPDPEELERRPDRNAVHTPEAFKALFNKAFAARDFDSILDAIKATSDVSVWKPMLREAFANQATDPIWAQKADWFRHVFNGTRPPEAVPRPAPKATTHPPGPTPRPGAPPPPKPPPGTPPPPPAPPRTRIPVEPITGGGAKSPFKIIEDFSRDIGKAIRVLRMKKNGLGVYRPGSTLTAERFAGDLDTAAHELAGHWTDDRYGIGKPWVKPRTRSPYDTELAKFWIHGSVTPTSTLRYRRAEGIAEFIRAYVVNPLAAMREAPTFGAYFEKTLPPEALKSIQRFGEDVRRWAGEDPLVRAGLNIRMDPPTLRERLWRGMTGRGFGFEMNPVDKLRMWFDDAYHYAVKAFSQAAKLRGLPVKPQDNFELLARLLSTHDSRMSDQFERGLEPLRPKQTPNAKGELEVERSLDPVTQEPMSLKWLLNPFTGTSPTPATLNAMRQNMREASAYMVAQRTLEKGVQLGRDQNVSGIGAGIMTDKAAAQELLARVAADPVKQSMLAESARRYRLWADKNIQMLVDAGRLSPERAADIRNDNQFYVDMHRLSEDFLSANRKQRGIKIGTTSDVVKRFKGSTLELDNVYSNLLEQTDAIQKEAHRNVAMRSFTDGLENVRQLHGPDLKDFDQFGRKVTSADANTITVYDHGKPEHWQFAPEIYESLKGMGELQTNAIWKVFTLPSQFARYMITHGLSFLTRNIIRDTVDRTVVSRSGSKPWDIFQGYSQAELSRYESFGGGQFGNYIVDRHVWNRVLKSTMRDLSKDPGNILVSPLKVKHAWDSLSEKSEKIGRIAEFRRAFEAGKKQLSADHPAMSADELNYNAALYAAGQSRGLMDFAKAGTVMRFINQAIPFSNAAIRGLARSFTSARENPASFAIRWSLGVLAPTLAAMMWNRSDDKTWKEYLQLPAYRRDLFWNLKVGDHWIVLPKPHILGALAGGVERMVIAALGEKHQAEGFAGSLASSALPVQNVAEGTGPLKTWLELEFNRDSFRNRDIVPVWERDLRLDLRKGTEHASEVGKGIANAVNTTGLGIDPRQVDHVLNSYGGLGNLVTGASFKNQPVSEAALRGTGLVAGSTGSNARDVQWVLDWARKNGKLQLHEVVQLRDLRGQALNARGDAKIKANEALIDFAIALRKDIEAGTSTKYQPKVAVGMSSAPKRATTLNQLFR